MKYIKAVFIILIFGSLSLSAQNKAALKTQKDKVSYIIGINLGKDFKTRSLDINPDAFMKGIKDALAGAKPLLTDEESQEVMMAFQKEMMAKQAEMTKELSEKNKKEGEAFLAANKKKEGVKTLPSGLQYKIIKEGTGKTPKATDSVIVHYRGTLVDGKEFDSSYKRGEPTIWPANGFIKGWTEALLLMKIGSKWELYIPSELAYEDRGAGAGIGPNATLIFELELLGVK